MQANCLIGTVNGEFIVFIGSEVLGFSRTRISNQKSCLKADVISIIGYFFAQYFAEIAILS